MEQFQIVSGEIGGNSRLKNSQEFYFPCEGTLPLGSGGFVD
jgi:hypothetical protein